MAGAVASPAAAQDGNAYSQDPESPGGSQYLIPVEQVRRDLDGGSGGVRGTEGQGERPPRFGTGIESGSGSGSGSGDDDGSGAAAGGSGSGSGGSGGSGEGAGSGGSSSGTNGSGGAQADGPGAGTGSAGGSDQGSGTIDAVIEAAPASDSPVTGPTIGIAVAVLLAGALAGVAFRRSLRSF